MVGNKELTLDPENWQEFRALAHGMLDEMLDHLESLREHPVWQPIPVDVQARLSTQVALPEQGEPLEAVYRAFVTDVLPYTSGNRHPRAWGWMRGNGTPTAMLAEMLAAGINAHVGGGHSAPVLVEEQVLDWLRRILGMPEGTSGVLTSGASVANMLGLVVARYAQLGPEVHSRGMTAFPRCTIYGSEETHFWVRKAVRVLGLGEQAFRSVRVGADGRVDVCALLLQMQEDRKQGLLPLTVIGNVGTVNTGAFDDLLALRELCDAEGVWLHVDAAFGAWLKLLPEEHRLVAGLESADSVAFDLHKWLYQPFASGCLLVRNRELHEAALRTSAAYIEPESSGPLSGSTSFSSRGLDHSRPFAALKVWMTLRSEGLARLRAMVRQNLEQARALAASVSETEDLRLLTPNPSNVVCFAYRPAAEVSGREMDDLQRRIALALAEEGRFLVSHTQLQTEEGLRVALRVAHANHRTRWEDLRSLLDAVRLHGSRLCASGRYGVLASPSSV
jgi:aromatic-L-amino-acid/L-tryptophan decarboxylase